MNLTFAFQFVPSSVHFHVRMPVFSFFACLFIRVFVPLLTLSSTFVYPSVYTCIRSCWFFRLFLDSLVSFGVLSFVRSINIPPLLRSCIYFFTASVLPPFNHKIFHPSSVFDSLAHLLVRSFVRSFICSCVRAFLRLFMRSFVRACVCSFFRSFLCSFIRSFVRAFVS